MNRTELLFTEILGCQRHELYLGPRPKIDLVSLNRLKQALLKMDSGIPVQQILGRANFMGFDFMIKPCVFIPRPETEILVEVALKYAGKIKDKMLNMLDLGTGSGCIAVSLAKFLNQARISACDISIEALKVARRNARLNNAKVKFFKSDLFCGLPLKGRVYDLIISNPPYIPKPDIQNLPLEVKSEPRIALEAGPDGLRFYRRIVKGFWRHLSPSGYLILEIGDGQSAAIKKLFKNSGKSEIIDMIRDYNNRERVLVARLKRTFEKRGKYGAIGN